MSAHLVIHADSIKVVVRTDMSVLMLAIGDTTVSVFGPLDRFHAIARAIEAVNAKFDADDARASRRQAAAAASTDRAQC